MPTVEGMRRLLVAACLVLTGCGGNEFDVGETPIRESDALSSDLGADVQPSDGPTADTGQEDAPVLDTGASPDAKTPDSASPLDTGAFDSGTPPFDTGTPPFDSGTPLDTGTFDTGTPLDTGPFDTGTFDTGTFDTGTPFDSSTSFDTGKLPPVDAEASLDGGPF